MPKVTSQPAAATKPRGCVTGVNGKTYRPKQTPEKRFLRALCAIAKLATTVDELLAGSDTERVQEGNLSDIRQARDALNQVIEKLEGVTTV